MNSEFWFVMLVLYWNVDVEVRQTARAEETEALGQAGDSKDSLC